LPQKRHHPEGPVEDWGCDESPDDSDIEEEAPEFYSLHKEKKRKIIQNSLGNKALLKTWQRYKINTPVSLKKERK
jgi:hypothetical protein